MNRLRSWFGWVELALAVALQVGLMIAWEATGGLKGNSPFTWTQIPGLVVDGVVGSIWRARPDAVEFLVYHGTQIVLFWLLIIRAVELFRFIRRRSSETKI
jgi:hypothetical protein